MQHAAETELACLERDEDVGLADLGLRLDEAKWLAAALQAEMVPAQMAASGKCPRACEACGRRPAAKGHYGATFRSLFGNVSMQVRRLTMGSPSSGRACHQRTVLTLVANGFSKLVNMAASGDGANENSSGNARQTGRHAAGARA